VDDRRATAEYSHTCAIAVAMDRSDAAWRAELARQTPATVPGGLSASISPVVVGTATTWIREVVR
jgi:hypothetical protein